MNADDPPLDPKEEAFIQAETARALAPYEGVAPPYMLETMRAALDDLLRNHTLLRRMRRALHPREDATSVQNTGEVPRDGEAGAALDVDIPHGKIA